MEKPVGTTIELDRDCKGGCGNYPDAGRWCRGCEPWDERAARLGEDDDLPSHDDDVEDVENEDEDDCD